MSDPIIPILHAWQSFYLLVGAAAATLIGLVFIAVTFGAGLVEADTKVTLDAWVTPIIVHFGAVLFLAALINVPTLSSGSLGVLLSLGSLIVLFYLAFVAYKLLRMKGIQTSKLTLVLWQVALPIVGYLFVLWAGINVLQNGDTSLNGAAIGTAIFLLIGIRNAWDLTIWIVQNSTRK